MNVQMFPSFFRIVPAYSTLNGAKKKLLTHYAWHRFGLIRQTDEPRFSVVSFLFSYFSGGNNGVPLVSSFIVHRNCHVFGHFDFHSPTKSCLLPTTRRRSSTPSA